MRKRWLCRSENAQKQPQVLGRTRFCCFYGCFLVIEARGGICFRTSCPIVVRSRLKCQRQRPDPAKGVGSVNTVARRPTTYRLILGLHTVVTCLLSTNLVGFSLLSEPLGLLIGAPTSTGTMVVFSVMVRVYPRSTYAPIHAELEDRAPGRLPTSVSGRSHHRHPRASHGMSCSVPSRPACP